MKRFINHYYVEWCRVAWRRSSGPMWCKRFQCSVHWFWWRSKVAWIWVVPMWYSKVHGTPVALRHQCKSSYMSNWTPIWISLNRFQFRHKSNHPSFGVVPNHWRLILLDTNKCRQPEYDSAVFGVADTKSWSTCIVDICWWRHIIDDAVLVQWITDLCDIQRLWSTHNQIGTCSRSIAAVVRHGYPWRLSWIIWSIYCRCIQCGAKFIVDMPEFDVSRCVGRFL